MTIIGQNYGRRRRPMGPMILVVIAIAMIGLLVLAWSRGGEVPTQRVQKAIPLPATAQGGAGVDSTESEG